MYDVRRLRLLLELQRRGTLSAVAIALNYSPSTISEQLTQLEVEANVRLFDRTGGRVRFTAQADLLAHHAEIVLRQLEAAESALAQSLQEITGRVRIAAFQTAILGLITPVWHILAERYPGIRIEVIQEEPRTALPRMLAYDYDLVIAEEFPTSPLPLIDGVDVQPLLDDPMHIVLPSGTPVQQDRVWEAVAERPWAIEPSASHDWILALCRTAGFEPDIRFLTEDLLVQQHLVAQGNAVAILPELLGSRSDPRVMTVEIPDGPHTRRVLTATRQDFAAHPAIEACRSILKDHVSHMQRG